MGILANGALLKTTGEEEIQAFGAGGMGDVVEGMEGNKFVDWDLFQTDWSGAVKGAMVTTRTGRVVIVQPGVC